MRRASGAQICRGALRRLVIDLFRSVNCEIEVEGGSKVPNLKSVVTDEAPEQGTHSSTWDIVHPFDVGLRLHSAELGFE